MLEFIFTMFVGLFCFICGWLYGRDYGFDMGRAIERRKNLERNAQGRKSDA